MFRRIQIHDLFSLVAAFGLASLFMTSKLEGEFSTRPLVMAIATFHLAIVFAFVIIAVTHGVKVVDLFNPDGCLIAFVIWMIVAFLFLVITLPLATGILQYVP